jgi:hypothetical protein
MGVIAFRPVGRQAAVVLVVGIVLAACDDPPTTSAPASTRSSPSTVPAGSPPPSTTPSPTVEAPRTAEEALARFQGYPPLHGTLAHQEGGYEEIVYEMWIDEPALWVNIVGATEFGPWVSDGQTSNIVEPHVHIGALLATDPREATLGCDHLRLIGSDEVLGRPVTGISCRSVWGDGTTTLWLDDETGMILAGESHGDEGSSSWGFSELELDPAFPPGIFDLHPAPPMIWFEVPEASLGAEDADDMVARAIAAFPAYPPLHGTLAVHDEFDDDTFEVWIREPDLRIDVVIPGTSYPWVGETGDEPPDPYWRATQVDPRIALPQCVGPDLLAHEDVLGRPATAITCPVEGNDGLMLWLDDETGLIVRAYWERFGEAGWFGFTELEMEPAFPSDAFDVAETSGP